MKKFKFILITFLLIFAGCEVLTPLAISTITYGYTKWADGEAETYYAYDSPTMYRACKRVAREMNIVITKDDPPDTKGNAYIVCKTENDTFKISIEHVEESISVVKIRLNFMGDKPYAELFYKNLDDEVSVIEFDVEGRPKKRKYPLLEYNENIRSPNSEKRRGNVSELPRIN